MVFSSSVFFMAFLPITLLLYFLIPERFLKVRNLWLLIASLIFYGWGEPKYIVIMIFTILLNYICALLIHSNRTKGKQAASDPVHRRKPCDSRIFQIHGFCHRDGERSLRRRASPSEHCPADWNFVLHISDDVLYHRCLPGESPAAA